MVGIHADCGCLNEVLATSGVLVPFFIRSLKNWNISCILWGRIFPPIVLVHLTSESKAFYGFIYPEILYTYEIGMIPLRSLLLLDPWHPKPHASLRIHCFTSMSRLVGYPFPGNPELDPHPFLTPVFLERKPPVPRFPFSHRDPGVPFGVSA
eukprot:scaffold207_cov345-Pavlova_lutheri.AAC.13